MLCKMILATYQGDICCNLIFTKALQKAKFLMQNSWKDFVIAPNQEGANK